MLLRRILVPLGLKHFQGLNQLLPRLAWLDHSVHVTALSSDVGVSKAVAEFFYFLLPGLGTVLGAVEFAFVNNVHGALGAHDGDFGRGPGVVYIRSDVL